MMRPILFILLLLASTGLFAQAFSVSGTDVSIDSEMKDDVELHIDVFNNTDSVINVTWERQEVTLPADWASAICDPVRCWATTVDSKTFDIAVGARDVELIAHVYPEINTPGTAVLRVKMYEDNHPTESITTEFTFNVSLSTGLTEIEERSVKLFPNPTQGAFVMDVNLSASKAVQLSLVNTLGQMIYSKDYGQISGQHRLSYEGDQLPQGIYYVVLEVDEARSAFRLSVTR